MANSAQIGTRGSLPPALPGEPPALGCTCWFPRGGTARWRWGGA